MESMQTQNTSVQRLQNVEKRIVRVSELAGGVMDELANPASPRKDLLSIQCGEFMKLIKDIQVTLREEIKSACEYRPFEKSDYGARLANEISCKKLEYTLAQLDSMKQTIDEYPSTQGEENPPRSRHKKMTHKTHPPRSLSFTSQTSSSSSSSTQSSRKQGRFTRSAGGGEEEGTSECSVECTRQSCRACSAALVADCVALTFIKVPYAMGKRCLGRKKRREKGKKKLYIGNNGDIVMERSKDIVFEFGEDGVVEQRR